MPRAGGGTRAARGEVPFGGRRSESRRSGRTPATRAGAAEAAAAGAGCCTAGGNSEAGVGSQAGGAPSWGEGRCVGRVTGLGAGGGTGAGAAGRGWFHKGSAAAPPKPRSSAAAPSSSSMAMHDAEAPALGRSESLAQADGAPTSLEAAGWLGVARGASACGAAWLHASYAPWASEVAGACAGGAPVSAASFAWKVGAGAWQVGAGAGIAGGHKVGCGRDEQLGGCSHNGRGDWKDGSEDQEESGGSRAQLASEAGQADAQARGPTGALPARCAGTPPPSSAADSSCALDSSLATAVACSWMADADRAPSAGRVGAAHAAGSRPRVMLGGVGASGACAA
eukprot:3034186-Pleurochrysis_carterae.AAC.1